MMQSTLFYMGIVVFSMMSLGLALTVLEFKKLAATQKKTQPNDSPVVSATDSNLDADGARLKILNGGQA